MARCRSQPRPGRPASKSVSPTTRTRASARVQIVDQPETADFAVTDDADAPEPSACAAAAARMIGIAASGTGTDAIIYLSRDADADYRIFVRSTRITAREAAALVVAAGAPARAVTAALAGGS